MPANAVPDTTTNLPTMFKNLQYGIISFGNTYTMKDVLVDSCDFINNKTGYYLSAETFASVIKNRFVSKFPIFTPDNDTLLCGLYLDGSILFRVEENRFNSNYKNGNSRHNKAIGVVVNNCGGYDNMIYNNTFDSLDYATIAQNHNRNKGNPPSGLQYKCNLFEDNWQDIAVTWDGNPSSLNGIAEHQGSADNVVTAPAGNRFSRLNTWSYSDFNNEGEHIIYHLPHWQELINNKKLNPIYYTSQTITKNTSQVSPWDSINGCPSHLSAKSKTELKSDIAANETNRSTFADSLDTKIDNGNTNSLNLDVVTSFPPETMQLRDQLLDASPYLSDTVMVNAAEKEDVLPNSIITEILAENPQSAKAENVLNTLNERNNPPNDNEMAQIHANDTVLGNKESLESKLAFYRVEKARNTTELIRLFQQDETINAKPDSIENTLDHINSPGSRYLQAFCRYNKGDSTGVLNILNDITSDFDLTSYEQNYQNYFEDYFDILLSLQAQNKTIYETDNTQKAVLHSIADNTSGLLQVFARNLLIKTDGIIYHEPYILLDTTTNKSAEIKTKEHLTIWNNDDYFTLYPNPATSYLTIEYKLNYGISNPVIEIISLSGKHLNTFRLQKNQGVRIIDLRQYNTGTYLVRLTNNGQVLQTGKFVKL
ncbi:MAG: hypothetical protein DRJ09_10715 [Bacteroidetes bacterium]|nr:MAG: hypothetical protein DRJ09_10715 [Bacteroidota bacterium]